MGTLSLLKDVGVTWFREEDYPILLEIFDDADKMPGSWNEWLKSAQQMEEWAKAQGYRTQRVYIDPDSFADWCLCEGMGTDSQGRQKFALDTLAARYANTC
jgi:hypothetical protein